MSFWQSSLSAGGNRNALTHARNISNAGSLSRTTSPPLPPAPAPTISVAQTCAECSQPLSGQFVRALGQVYHLDCFRCKDCDVVVASKFFPIETADGAQQPLCETDYFRRLNLICAKCERALRASYITAVNKKYHVEHFTCSVCPTLFGPQDSYYEHQGDVYCRFHYSTRFAAKCAGCDTAILKQFVEINRNGQDEVWHPECYMINKFWNIRLAKRERPNEGTDVKSSESQGATEPWIELEERYNAESLEKLQVDTEMKTYRIWTTLSTFEEKAAANFSNIIQEFNSQNALAGIRSSEIFLLFVQILFASLTDLDNRYEKLGAKKFSYIREARMLFRSIVDYFTLFSHMSQGSARRSGLTQETLALMTKTAHYLKVLIRIFLAAMIKLEREYGDASVMYAHLNVFDVLSKLESYPSAERLEKYQADGILKAPFGFPSLSPELAGKPPFTGEPNESGRFQLPQVPSDTCEACKQTVEEDSLRLSTYQRYHARCVICWECGQSAEGPELSPTTPSFPVKETDSETIKPTKKRHSIDSSFRYRKNAKGDSLVFCGEHAPQYFDHFQITGRLEQYAYLLNLALKRLYLLLGQRGVFTQAVESTPLAGDRESIARRRPDIHLWRTRSTTGPAPPLYRAPTAKPTKFRVLIIGRTGCGKTTILAKFCPKSEAGGETRGLHNIENELVAEDDYNFVAHDSRGFEAGTTAEVDIVMDFLQKRANLRSEDQIHVIWYCIQANSRPLQETELGFFSQPRGQVAVICIVTKFDLLVEECLQKIMEADNYDEEEDEEFTMEKAVTMAAKIYRTKYEEPLLKMRYPPNIAIKLSNVHLPVPEIKVLHELVNATRTWLKT
ncbi:hypothetical protein SISNIDRAFT_453465 [Sistotremastrum niveocremeum HHB9708]|uniref:LIM zinc-binding domain-containing protein n=2 Tax=Sistotremastraceae TaxID=3402574 RepID=A0A164VWI5_9AGAM|nr:hypothetical protein SISNIDRAFT_453465 [Sistotremastrum niveocremeum HHB9708]KZT43198.1 hypothetical protein SISSUDRAFT_1040652 [Sistotremastrum suecicum HHB10207 ss-3]